MSVWTRRYLVIVKAAFRNAANTKYASIDTDGAGDKTFNVPLATVAKPGTIVAYATHTHITEEMVARYASHIQDYIDAGHVAVYRTDNGAWTVKTAMADLTKKPARLTLWVDPNPEVGP